MKLFKRLIVWVMLVSLVLIVTSKGTLGWIGVCVFLGLGFSWFVIAVVRVGWAAGGEINKAISPQLNLSPIQIAQQMRQELGREPTFEEVAAVHQMLMSERNQALVRGGLGLGALLVIGNGGRL
jgi:hypothetical protein